MKRLARLLALLAVCFFLFGQSSFAGDFSNLATSSRSLFFKDNNGKPLKTISAKSTDRSLSGTGLTGTVTDGGDHWILNVTGGILYGTVNTGSGLEIRLVGGSQAAISTTRGSNAINGGGGVRICGPGMLHIDQHSKYPAIVGGLGNIAFTLGAVVGINGLGGATPVKGNDVRVLASALHVNAADANGIDCDGSLSIGESIVTVCATKAAIYQHESSGSLTITASCVHLISSKATALQCGDDISGGAKTLSVANSVFCALGAGHGIQGTLTAGGSSLAFDNVVGVVAGKNCGIYAAKEIFVDGGSTKLSIAGNITGNHTPGDTTAVDYLSGNNSSGQGIRPISPSRGYFGVEAGNVKLFSPGVCALDCGTNAVTGGKLEIPGKATYGDFQTLFTWQGAISAAEIFMGRSLFESDFIYYDFDIAQAFAGVLAPSAALFYLSDAKARTGITADMLYVSGGEVSVEASGVGIHLGGCYASHGAYLTQKGGRISVEAGRVAIADDDAVDGSVSYTAKDSGIWLAGGRLRARGGGDGILTCGYVLQEGGTLEAAATGGYTAGTVSSKPGLRGYALSANNGFAIDGGSFVATAGTVRTAPNTSSSHNFAKVYPCDLSVPGTGAVSISGMVPSWYGVNDLYPVGGKLRFWLPVGSASLKYGGVQYTANGTGKVVAGSNVFRSGSAPATTLALAASSRSFTAAAASSKELGVTANVAWSAKSSASWLVVKTASGSGNGKIVYNVAANTGNSSRTATITVAGGGLTRTFTVTQSGKSDSGGTGGGAVLSLSRYERTFGCGAADGKELGVTANVSWTAKSSVPWVTVKTASGKGNGKIVFNVAANAGTSSRTGSITVSGGGLAQTYKVMQNGNDSSLALAASSRSFTADAANSKELRVTANVAWKAKSSASWLAVKTASGSGNGKIVYNVAANTGSASRTATITVTGGGLTRTFTVTQGGRSGSGAAATLALGASSRSFSAAAANNKELAVTATVAWTAKSSASWLAVKTASGSGNGKIVYNVAANAGTGSRTAKITVSGGMQTRTFTVTQQGAVVWTYTVNSGVAVITCVEPAAGDLAIPATLGGYPVTGIYREFENCKNLTGVTIPNGVRALGAWAFCNCSGLKTVSIPASLTSFHIYGPFSGCSSLKSFTVASGNPEYKSVSGLLLTKDGKELVFGVNGNVSIPYGVKSIRAYAFDGRSGLTGVTIPGSVTDIDYKAFFDCSGLASVTIPSSVATIGSSAFQGCTGLASVAIPNGVRSIAGHAFYGCRGLNSVTIPASVTNIDEGAFGNCSLASVSVASGNPAYKSVSGLLLTKDGKTLVCGVNGNVVIPSGVTRIASYAFSGCTGLTGVTIPSSVTNIGYDAFAGCSGLTSVAIPASVTGIRQGAFSGCSGLKTFSVAGGNPAYKSVSGLLLTKDGKTLVGGVNGNVVIPSSVTSIESAAFSGCSGLTGVTIPSSVKSIESSAFSGCSGLASVTIPASVTWIDGNVFSRCSSLASFSVASGNPSYKSVSGLLLTKDGKELVAGVRGNVAIPSGVKRIGMSAFSGCSGLTGVTIPASVTNIGYAAFSGCSGLTSVTIPASVTGFETEVFPGCTRLAALYVPVSWKGTDMLRFEDLPAGCRIVYSVASKAVSRLKGGGLAAEPRCGGLSCPVWVTTSDGRDGDAVVDGYEGTGWGPVGEGGGWVVLTYPEAIGVKGVSVKGENLPEEGVRVLLSEDADDWREGTEGRAQYVWVAVPEEAAGATLTEIEVEEE